MKSCRAFVFVLCVVTAAACSDSSPSAPGTPGGSTALSAPTPSSPADAAQLSTLRPTLVVTNAASGQSGAKVYEFQVSDRSDFAAASSATIAPFTVFANQTSVPEGAGGTTSFTPGADLQPATRLYWRSRVTQGTTTSDWSATRTFNSQIVGFSQAGALYDPLTANTTIGTPIGSTTFVAGRGIKINTEDAYVRYQLLTTISNGEMSVEVEGLYGNGPGGKLKILSMFDGTGNLYASKYLFNVQYRGLDGNPDNAISFKALFGDEDLKFEPDFNQRAASVMSLNPARTYFWKATWGSEVRVVIQDGRGGPTIYNLGLPADGTYAPSAALCLPRARAGRQGEETGSWPGAIYRNLWISSSPRPSTLGNAVN